MQTVTESDLAILCTFTKHIKKYKSQESRKIGKNIAIIYELNIVLKTK